MNQATAAESTLRNSVAEFDLSAHHQQFLDLADSYSLKRELRKEDAPDK